VNGSRGVTEKQGLTSTGKTPGLQRQKKLLCLELWIYQANKQGGKAGPRLRACRRTGEGKRDLKWRNQPKCSLEGWMAILAKRLIIRESGQT